jgi:hypothetical protein
MSIEAEAVQSYINFLSGSQWRRNRENWRSSFFDNRLNNSRKNDLALLTDSRPTINVSTLVEAYKQQAQICQSLIQGEWIWRS